ncbi:MAG: DUF4878 domain-containing protein [Planctomycetota bacterium]|nr:DUF4878 domain-containing protein [Planctomycetota bacterium]
MVAKGVLGPCKKCDGAGFNPKYFKTVFWEYRTKAYQDEMKKKSGSTEKFLKQLAESLRSSSHTDTKFTQKFSSYTVKEVTVDGTKGRTLTQVVTDATSGAEYAEEIEWVKDGSEWYLKSEYDK